MAMTGNFTGPGPFVVDIVPNRVSRRMRLATVAQKMGGQFATPSAGTVGVTHAGIYVLPFVKIQRVRARVLNIAGVQQLACKLAVAFSNSAADPVTPSGAWLPVLFGASATFDTVAATITTTNNAVPTEKLSDDLVARSIDRTDGGTGTLFYARLEVPAAGNTVSCRFADYAAAPQALETTRHRFFFRSGAFVTTPGGMTLGNSTEWQAGLPVYFEFDLIDGASLLMPGGDSTVQGQDGSYNLNGAARKASEAMNAAGSRIAYFCAAHSSMTAAVSLSNLLTWVATHKPTVAIINPYSHNGQVTGGDQYSQAGLDLVNDYCRQAIAACKAVGTIPALRTPGPAGGINATQEGWRRAAVADIKAYCAQGAAVLIDADSVLTDYTSSTGGFKAAYVNGASLLHTNDAGYDAEAALVIAQLGDLLR